MKMIFSAILRSDFVRLRTFKSYTYVNMQSQFLVHIHIFFSRKILKFCGGLTKVHVDTQNARSNFTKDLITNKYLSKKPRNIVCLKCNFKMP